MTSPFVLSQTLLAKPENHLGALQEEVVISSSTIVNLD
jgi:hypothetical protein